MDLARTIPVLSDRTRRLERLERWSAARPYVDPAVLVDPVEVAEVPDVIEPDVLRAEDVALEELFVDVDAAEDTTAIEEDASEVEAAVVVVPERPTGPTPFTPAGSDDVRALGGALIRVRHELREHRRLLRSGDVLAVADPDRSWRATPQPVAELALAGFDLHDAIADAYAAVARARRLAALDVLRRDGRATDLRPEAAVVDVACDQLDLVIGVVAAEIRSAPAPARTARVIDLREPAETAV